MTTCFYQDVPLAFFDSLLYALALRQASETDMSAVFLSIVSSFDQHDMHAHTTISAFQSQIQSNHAELLSSLAVLKTLADGSFQVSQQVFDTNSSSNVISKAFKLLLASSFGGLHTTLDYAMLASSQVLSGVINVT